jgi:GTP cyclohydrolase II
MQIRRLVSTTMNEIMAFAARMLQMLNCSQILLFTNNAAKLDGLTRAGIGIAARIPLETSINPYNKRYLTTKAARPGRRLFNLKTLAAEKY